MFAQVWEWGRLSAEGWGARDQGAGKQLLQEAGNAGRAAPRLDTVKVGHHLSATLWVVTHSLPVVPQSALPISHQRILAWSSLPPPPHAGLATSLGCFPLPQASFLTGALSSLLPILLPVIPGYLETLAPQKVDRGEPRACPNLGACQHVLTFSKLFRMLETSKKQTELANVKNSCYVPASWGHVRIMRTCVCPRSLSPP